MDPTMFDNEKLERILLLPDGRKMSIADESMLTSSVDFKFLSRSRAKIPSLG